MDANLRELERAFIYLLAGVGVFLVVTFLHMMILNAVRELYGQNDLISKSHLIFVAGYVLVPLSVGAYFSFRYGPTLGLCMIVAVCFENVARVATGYPSWDIAGDILLPISIFLMAYVIYSGENMKGRN